MFDQAVLEASENDAVAVDGRRRRWRPWRWLGGGAATAVVVLAVGLFASQLGTDPRLLRSPLIGRPAPEFDLRTVDGGRVTSADFVGRPYVVNFWATWCVACRREHPYLMSFYRRWAPSGVGMVGIVYNDTPDAVRDYRSKMATPWPDALDPGGRSALDFGVYGVPETFVVDANGVVVFKLIGEAKPGSLDRIIGQLVARP